MDKHRLLLAGASGILAVAVLHGTASAEATDDNGDDDGIETIVVTAERIEQDAQEVAASLTAFDREDIDKSAIETLQDLDRAVPNLILANQGSPRFTINSIRGISNTVRADYFSQTIGVYVDGVPLTAAELTRAFDDAERIEVLRGPQGTLYGRNTPGGIINVISRQPTDAFVAEAEAAFGNNAQRGASAFLSGPIAGERVHGKLFAKYRERDGYTDYAGSDDTIDDLESVSASAALKFVAGEATSIALSGSLERIDEGAYAFQAFDDFAERELAITSPNREDRDTEALTLVISQDFGAAELISISGFRAYEVLSDQDLAYNPLIVTFGGGRGSSVEEGEQYSQEIRLTGATPDAGLNWTLGTFYSLDDVRYDYLFDVPAFGPPSLFSSDYERQELAGFAELTAAASERLDLTAGVRVAEDDQALVSNSGVDDGTDSTIVTPRVRAVYRFDADRKFYLMATRGARTGGLNRLSAGGDRFDPEFLWSYEAGLKSSWLNRTLTVNAAVFFIDWTDQQILTQTGPGAVEIANAGEASNRGAEVEIAWAPNRSWEFSGFLGFNDSEYDAFISDTGANLSGNELVNTPEFTAGVAVQYEGALFDGRATGWIRPEYSYIGDHFFDPQNRLEQSGYGIFSLSAGVEGERFRVSAFVRNLFDEDYRVYGFTDNINNYDIAVAGKFRTFGVKLRATF